MASLKEGGEDGIGDLASTAPLISPTIKEATVLNKHLEEERSQSRKY